MPLFHVLAALVVLVVLTAFSSTARAQVNTDTLRPGPPPGEGLSGVIDMNLTRNAGNVDLLDFGMSGRMQATTFHPLGEGDPQGTPFVKNIVVLMGHLRYGQRAGDTAINNGFLYGRYQRMWLRRVGSSVFAQHQFNEFQRLRVRSVWGASVAFSLIHLPFVDVNVGTGYMFEFNRITAIPGTSDPPETFEHRWLNSIVARFTALQGKVVAQSTTYFQPRFDAFTDIRFLEELEVMARVTDRVSVGGTFNVLIDTAPPTGVEPVDTRLLSNLRFAF